MPAILLLVSSLVLHLPRFRNVHLEGMDMQTGSSTKTYTLCGALPEGMRCALNGETRYFRVIQQGRSITSFRLLPLEVVVLSTLLDSYPEPCSCDAMHTALMQRTGRPYDKWLPTLLKECRTVLQPCGLGISAFAEWIWICKLEEEEVDLSLGAGILPCIKRAE